MSRAALMSKLQVDAYNLQWEHHCFLVVSHKIFHVVSHKISCVKFECDLTGAPSIGITSPEGEYGACYIVKYQQISVKITKKFFAGTFQPSPPQSPNLATSTTGASDLSVLVP